MFFLRWKSPNLCRFARNEDGAITVDWIVLTATTVFLGMAAAFYIATSVPIVADATADYLENVEVAPE